YEIERKFLVNGEYKSFAFKQYRIQQGYLSVSKENVVRVRVRDDKGFLTIKSGAVKDRFTRHEWEYEIPLADADEMLCLCAQGVIDKTRYLVKAGAHTLEVDEFYGDNEGLVFAEV
ncbi:MAG TPA: adenylate cyclase, partial [Porphyromonadaceae bacterium]|nr:adenylate cyclase [Porphyromonadaceae bacterium]